MTTARLRSASRRSPFNYIRQVTGITYSSPPRRTSNPAPAAAAVTASAAAGVNDEPVMTDLGEPRVDSHVLKVAMARAGPAACPTCTMGGVGGGAVCLLLVSQLPGLLASNVAPNVPPSPRPCSLPSPPGPAALPHRGCTCERTRPAPSPLSQSQTPLCQRPPPRRHRRRRHLRLPLVLLMPLPLPLAHLPPPPALVPHPPAVPPLLQCV